MPFVSAGANHATQMKALIKKRDCLSPGTFVGFVFTENQTAQLVAQSLGLLRIARGAEAFGKLEKGLLFLSPRFDAEFNELHQNTVVAQSLALCHALHLFGDGSGERY